MPPEVSVVSAARRAWTGSHGVARGPPALQALPGGPARASAPSWPSRAPSDSRPAPAWGPRRRCRSRRGRARRRSERSGLPIETESQYTRGTSARPRDRTMPVADTGADTGRSHTSHDRLPLHRSHGPRDPPSGALDGLCGFRGDLLRRVLRRGHAPDRPRAAARRARRQAVAIGSPASSRDADDFAPLCVTPGSALASLLSPRRAMLPDPAAERSCKARAKSSNS